MSEKIRVLLSEEEVDARIQEVADISCLCPVTVMIRNPAVL